MRDLASEYEAEMGHPPPSAPEEDAWQWAYSERDRAKLVEILQGEAEAEAAEQLRLC